MKRGTWSSVKTSNYQVGKERGEEKAALRITKVYEIMHLRT